MVLPCINRKGRVGVEPCTWIHHLSRGHDMDAWGGRSVRQRASSPLFLDSRVARGVIVGSWRPASSRRATPIVSAGLSAIRLRCISSTRSSPLSSMCTKSRSRVSGHADPSAQASTLMEVRSALPPRDQSAVPSLPTVSPFASISAREARARGWTPQKHTFPFERVISAPAPLIPRRGLGPEKSGSRRPDETTPCTCGSGRRHLLVPARR